MKPLKEALISKDKRKWAASSVYNKYGITEKDLVGELQGLPVGVIVRMLEETEKQGNKPDVTIFQKNCCADYEQGGFDWDDTEAGGLFWDKVINLVNFKLFFDQYPKYKKYGY